MSYVFKSQGRDRPSATEFTARRSQTAASIWATQMSAKQPLYQKGVNCEPALRKTLDRTKSRASLMEEQHPVLMRPPTQDTLFSASHSKAIPGLSRPSSQLSLTRPATSLSWHSAPELLPHSRDSRPASALSVSHQAYARPAGLSRSKVGHELGLNMASNQAPAEEGEDEQSMPLGPQPPTLRFVPTRPMFLLNLVTLGR